MSSVYRVLCLSHPTAIELNVEMDRPETLEGLLAGQAHPDLRGHPGCDLVGGRYSYPLIKVYCPPRMVGSTAAPGARRCAHNGGEWIDVEWMRVALAYIRTDPQRPVELPRCWPASRLERLAHDLRVDEAS